MVSLVLLVFLVHLFIYLVNTIGAKTINDLLWNLSIQLPLSSSDKVKQQLKIRSDLVRLKKQMNSISAQDDFAKWAKVRREHDKVLALHDKVASETQSARTSFDRVASAIRWISTSGLRFFLQFWFGKQPMFDLPRGWFPWQVEFLLGFPRCPYGGVSINVWGAACATVIALVGDGITWVVLQYLGTGEVKQKQKVPVSTQKVPADKKEL